MCIPVKQFSVNKLMRHFLVILMGLAAISAPSALRFDGVDDCVVVKSQVIQEWGEISFCAWVKIDPSEKTGNIVAGPIILHTRGVGFYLGGEKTNSGYLNWDSDPELGRWRHLAATWGKGKMKLYVNGNKQEQERAFGDGREKAALRNGKILLGHLFNAGIIWYQGLMEDVRLYNRELTPLEVREIYLSDGNDRVNNGLALRWALNGKVGEALAENTTIADAGGKGNEGEAHGGPRYEYPLLGAERTAERDGCLKSRPEEAEAVQEMKQQIVSYLQQIESERRACENMRKLLDAMFKSHAKTGASFLKRLDELNNIYEARCSQKIFQGDDLLEQYRTLHAEFGLETLFEE